MSKPQYVTISIDARVPFCVKCSGELLIRTETYSDGTVKWGIACQGCGSGISGCTSLEFAIQEWTTRNPVEDLDELVERIVGGTSNAEEGSEEWNEAIDYVKTILADELGRRKSA